MVYFMLPCLSLALSEGVEMAQNRLPSEYVTLCLRLNLSKGSHLHKGRGNLCLCLTKIPCNDSQTFWLHDPKIPTKDMGVEVAVVIYLYLFSVGDVFEDWYCSNLSIVYVRLLYNTKMMTLLYHKGIVIGDCPQPQLLLFSTLGFWRQNNKMVSIPWAYFYVMEAKNGHFLVFSTSWKIDWIIFFSCPPEKNYDIWAQLTKMSSKSEKLLLNKILWRFRQIGKWKFSLH